MDGDPIDLIVRDVLARAATDIHADIVERLSNEYPPASKPGESPHKRTGDLVAGIEWSIERADSVYTLLLTSTAPYSRYLEFGAANLSPRPFMGPTLEVWAPLVTSDLQSAFFGSSPVVGAAA